MATVAVRRTPDWDALAAVWHCLENDGLDLATLRTMLPSLAAPLVYIGGGRGVFPARLASWLAPGRVTVVDSSIEMARRARREFGLTYQCADVRALPYRSAAFASAVCATGVLEYLSDADRVGSLKELARVTLPGAPTLVTTFSGTGVAGANAADGPLDAWWRDADDRPHRSLRLAFDAVARTAGGRDRAYRLLRDALPRGCPGLDPATMRRACERAGLTPAVLHTGAGATTWRLSGPSASGVTG